MNEKNKKLKDFFPLIRERAEILDEIKADNKLNKVYESWRTDNQEDFLDMCTGARGVKMLYDSYFKEILNPETVPDRLSYMLSTIIGQKVTVKAVLPNDSSRLGDEASLVITDIVVELEDGSIANIEVQKIGYAFTGERASCYSADLLLRQYKRVRDARKGKFSYKDISPVFTIVFMEKSPSVFHEYKNVYIHKFETRSDTGVNLKMLQNFIFIPVDIFIENLHNKGILNDLDAWLTFLGCDEPEYIIDLIQRYPYFKPLYEDLYTMCRNTERVMDMFSEELKILDRNTVSYMIDEMQAEIDKAKATIADNKAALAAKDAALADKDATIADNKAALAAKDAALADKDAAIADKDATIANNEMVIARLTAELKKCKK